MIRGVKSQHLKVMLNTIIATIVGILILGFIIVLSPILLPIYAVCRIHDSISLRIFRCRQAGHFYLICTSKHDWHDFLHNNVIPFLPDNVRVAWQNTKSHDKHHDIFRKLSQSKIYGLSKPYLVSVTKTALYARSLNVEFRKIKSSSKISEETRTACLLLIETTQDELLTRALG